MAQIRQVSYVKIGEKAGNKRLWLEGKRMSLCGFDRGARYVTVFDVEQRKLTLKIDENGDRQVSGRKRGENELPIIDLCSSTITQYVEEVLGDVPRVRVVFSAQAIEITVHPHDLMTQEREQRLREHLQQGVVSEATLCAGGGISSYALHEGLCDAGIRASSEFILDIEGKYLQNAIDNNPHIGDSTRIFEAALEEVETELLGPVDVLNVSLPCTGFSLAGKAKNQISFGEEHQAAGTAVFGLMQILPAVNPSIVISENVPQFKDSATYALIRGTLEKLGYQVQERILGREMGALEDRNRHIMVAVSKGLAEKFDLGTIAPSATAPKRLGEVLENIPSASQLWKTYDYLKTKQERDQASGKGFARQLVNGEAEKVGTIGRGYNKARSTEPFVQHPTDPQKSRLLTVVEHARVKGVPENAVAGLPATVAHEILGQSVLFPVFRSIGRHVGRLLNDYAASLDGPGRDDLVAGLQEVRQSIDGMQKELADRPASTPDDFDGFVAMAEQEYRRIVAQLDLLPEIIESAGCHMMR